MAYLSRGLRASTRSACQCQTPATLAAPRRQLSSSQVLSGSRAASFPAWVDSPNTELNEMLLQFRQESLLPYYFNKAQQRLATSPKNRATLENEPIEISIGKVPGMILSHIDFKDIPKRTQSVDALLHQVKEPEDYENVALLLEGLHGSDNGLSPSLRFKIFRKLIVADKLKLVMRAVADKQRFGFLIDDETMAYVLTAIHRNIALYEWDNERLRESLKAGETLVDLSISRNSPNHIKKSPLLVAAPLEAATKLISNGVATDLEKVKAREYAERFMALVEQDKLAEKRKWLDMIPHPKMMPYYIPPVIALWHAVRTALSVADEIGLKDQDLVRQLEENLRTELLEWKREDQKVRGPAEELALTRDLRSCGLEF